MHFAVGQQVYVLLDARIKGKRRGEKAKDGNVEGS